MDCLFGFIIGAGIGAYNAEQLRPCMDDTVAVVRAKTGPMCSNVKQEIGPAFTRMRETVGPYLQKCQEQAGSFLVYARTKLTEAYERPKPKPQTGPEAPKTSQSPNGKMGGA
eukprot:TRINITY_DN7756_c0_g1_i1.p1 TRINITY_DN7756_c0_g1~~TRINITY_DN7756_c0_g1_i1.p1  ORF type:complete len:112 (+),score=11.97 TRINITY_DN7756_c0_g1_i1:65-400(+)